MAAMTVAGFSACSNTEDEPVLPGMDGGNGGGGVRPLRRCDYDTIYQFNNIEAEYTPINELCPDWDARNCFAYWRRPLLAKCEIYK